MKRCVVVMLCALPLAGCELTEVALAEPEDVIVVEAILRAGEPEQKILVHRSWGLGLPPAADILVRAEDGTGHRFQTVPDSVCLLPADTVGAARSTCYGWTAGQGPSFVVPGARYTLHVTTTDGRELTGATRVPGDFTITRPTVRRCELTPDVQYEISWTASADTWVYIAEASLLNLRTVLRRRGIDLSADPLRLVGLSITREDTTIVFPSEFGLFDRFDEDLSEVLLVLQQGLPASVGGDVVIGAADRNYVNWVRGGNFNPSGTVRVPSVFGKGGTGVFGSVVTRERSLVTESAPGRPAC